MSTLRLRANHKFAQDMVVEAADLARHGMVGLLDAIIERIIQCTPAREDELSRDPRFQTIFAS